MYPQDDWLRFALGLPLRPSKGFSYCTAGVLALGIALERALGEPLSEFARIDAETTYGYLWWPKEYSGEPCYYMTGMGGNRVHVFPEREVVAVITSTNFGRRDVHALSDRLVTEKILA